MYINALGNTFSIHAANTHYYIDNPYINNSVFSLGLETSGELRELFNLSACC